EMIFSVVESVGIAVLVESFSSLSILETFTNRSGGKSTESKGNRVAIGRLEIQSNALEWEDKFGGAPGTGIFHCVKISISLSMPTTMMPSRTQESCIGSGGSPSTESNSAICSTIHRVTERVLSKGSSRLVRKLLGDTDVLPCID